MNSCNFINNSVSSLINYSRTGLDPNYPTFTILNSCNYTSSGSYLALSGGNMTGNIGFGIATPDSKIHIATPDNALITTNIFNFKNTSGYGIYTTSSTIANKGNTLDFFSRDYNGGTITTRNILSLNVNGNVGIGNPSADTGKLCIGSSVHSHGVSDGTLVISKTNAVNAHRSFKIGYDADYNFCMGDNLGNGTYTWRSTDFNIRYFDGNVGIGALANSSYKMRIRGTNPTYLRIETDTSAVAQVSGIEFGVPAYTNAGTAKITSTTYESDVNDLRFSTSSGLNGTSIKMTINGNGNISCTNDFTALGRITGNNITLGSGGKINSYDDYHYIQIDQPTDTLTIQEYGKIVFQTGVSKEERMRINNNGVEIGSYITLPKSSTSTGILNLALGGTSGADDNTNMKILMYGVNSGSGGLSGSITIRAYNHIKFFSNGQGTNPNLFINGIYGLVGVGIEPVAKLHVASGTYSSGWLENIALINSGSVGIVYWNNYFGGICAVFESNIWCKTNIMASSDSRIKKDIEDIDDRTALDKILSIQPKTYKYKDTLLKRDNRVIGFIAQQIKEVIPEAVELIPEYIPNIYKISTTNDDIINLDNTELLNVDDKIKIIDNSGKTEETKILEVNETSIKIDKTFNNEDVFVYGSKVDDFHSLDKSYIYTLNVCATQQLYKIIQLQEERIRILEEKLNQLI